MSKEKFIKPFVGQEIYMDTHLYCFRGADDFIGGLCKISKVIESDHLPEDHINYYFIEVEENKGSGSTSNYRLLLEKQEELKKEFGLQRGHKKPDLRPEFNDDNEGWTLWK